MNDRYLWHCDRTGNSSLYGTAAVESWLRGVQVNHGNGEVTFTTIFPAACSKRYPQRDRRHLFRPVDVAAYGRMCLWCSMLLRRPALLSRSSLSPAGRPDGRRFDPAHLLARMMLLLLFLLFAGVASAQLPALAPLSAQLGQADADLRAVDRTLDARVDDKERQSLRSKAAAQTSAADATKQLGVQLALDYSALATARSTA